MSKGPFFKINRCFNIFSSVSEMSGKQNSRIIEEFVEKVRELRRDFTNKKYLVDDLLKNTL